MATVHCLYLCGSVLSLLKEGEREREREAVGDGGGEEGERGVAVGDEVADVEMTGVVNVVVRIVDCREREREREGEREIIGEREREIKGEREKGRERLGKEQR